MKRQKLKRDAFDYNKNSDDSSEETELLTRKTFQREPQTTEITIEEGDTLQALSIRHHCSVAEIKRLNHIHNDNEIFAKRTIKVPHRPFSTILARVHNSGGSSPTVKPKSDEQVSPDVLEKKLHTFLSVPGNHNDENLSSFNEVIFNSTIASKPCDSESEDESHNDSDEEIHLLPNKEVAEMKVASKYFCSEKDLLWIALFCCMVVFVISIICVVYVTEHNNSTHLHHHTS